MKLKYEAPKGKRTKGGTYVSTWQGKRCRKSFFLHVTIFTPRSETGNFMWGYESKKWLNFSELPDSTECRGTAFPENVNSVRAFRRRLKQWSGQLPNGTEVILVSRLKKNSVTAFI